MSASVRVGEHIRRNAVAYVALFIALTGTSYAATKVGSGDIKKNAVKAKHVKDGQLTGAEIADDSLGGQDINEASLQGLGGGGTVADGSVTTAKLADGAVTTPKLSNLAVTEAKLDALAVTAAKLADNAVTSQKVADGTIVDADIAGGAAIDDAKLGTIDDAGKVADAALSSNVPRLNAGSQSFNGAMSILGGLNVALDGAETFDASASRTGNAFTESLEVGLINNTSGGGQDIVELTNLSGSAATETGLKISNFDADDPIAEGLEFNGNAFTTAIDASNGNIETALDVGSNDIETDTATISASELSTLDGNFETVFRVVNLPLPAFVNAIDEEALNFTPSNGTSPDLALFNGAVVIEYDDDSDIGGSDIADTDEIASTVSLPDDAATANVVANVRVSKDGHSGVTERIRCTASLNGAAPGGAGAAVTSTNASTNYSMVTPTPTTPTAQSSVGIQCQIEDGALGPTANDIVRIHSIGLRYVATQ